MSFISSRAKALRQRFVPTQRSMSDTWQDHHTQGYMEDDPRLPSPDLGGSMLSLLNEQMISWENDTDANTGSVFRAQRSRSLDSLGSVPVTASSSISPPTTLQFHRRISTSTQDTINMKIPRPTVSGLLIADLADSVSPSYPTSPIPKIPGPPPSPLRKSAPTTPRPVDSFTPHVSMPFIPKIPGPPISPKPSRPSSPPSSKFGDISTIKPKVTAHRVSSNLICPSTQNYSDSYYSESRTAQSLPVSPKYSCPTPKLLDVSFFDSQIIPRIPAPPPSPKLFLPPGAFSQAVRSSSPKPQDQIHLLDDCSTGSSKEPTPALSSELSPRSATPSTTTTTSKPQFDSTIGDSESFDHEENRDTITEVSLPARPTMFDLRPRPKLKHQWSMDETRTLSSIAGCTRQTSEVVGSNSCALKPAEKRRRFFMRKQTNSAPDSFDGALPVPPPKHKEHHSVSFCLGNVRRCRGSDSSFLPPALPTIQLEPELGVEHLPDLRYPDGDPPCHFCCQQTSTSIHDENRLKIVSGGLVRSRDGSRDDTGTHFMNLPSPNVQSEGDQETVFHRHSEEETDVRQQRGKEDGDLEEPAPPASALTRRRALVPPKLLTECADERKLSGSSNSNSSHARRSSIVVIPPMQICPGDLLVYSKVLTHRNNLLDLDGSSTSLAVSDTDGVNSRKGKNTWSLLRLFERSNRGKVGSLCGLEEVLSCMQRIDFDDEQLSRYRGMCWTEFVAHVEKKNSGAGSSSSSSSDSSLVSSPEPPPRPVSPPPVVTTPRRRLRGALVRAQSERCFERRLTGARAMWRGLDRTLPTKPSPLVTTLSEKDLLVSPGSTTSRAESKRREAVWDLFQSECAFLYDHLMVLKNVFMEPLKKIQVEGFAMFAEPELLFGNLDELCCVTYAFCKEFISLLLENVGAGGELPTIDVLVKLFQKSSEAGSVSQAYHCYALNYINALNYLETLRRHVEFCEFEKWCSRDPRCKKLQLTDLLVAPVQHIMKVPLILKEVETRTEDSAEREQITQILEVEENSIRELDDKMKWLKNFERLLEIQRNIVWPSVFELDPKIYVPEFLKPALTRQPCDRIIVSPRRQIIIEGPLQIWDTGKPQEMFVVLFDDMLLITRRKKGLSKKKSSLSENWASSCSRGSSASSESSMRYVVYKQPLSLDRFFIHDVTIPESASCRLEAAFVLVSLNRFQQVVTIHTFQAPSDQSKVCCINVFSM
ncbi:Pleckstrin homology domain-containing family G member 7 [Cryptotermes secundus]|uniref:Pleckstrin homology domain-containing family G member 7 n=1 Tax=Cryptotermes secundus TaxID=105785 RepID=A0A2J7PXS2_9NEOP|nr:Pleckstrin homology domain-containing family G member 7 [Cryptotermes secundus]